MSTAQKVLDALRASYHLEDKGGGQYRSWSPFPRANGTSNSPSMSLKITDDEHGTWYDFVAERGGSLYALAAELGIKPESAVEDTKRAYENPKEYALSHGLTEKDLEAAGWVFDKHKGRLALRFPTKTGRRWRFLDGKHPHYISVQGYKPCWYGLNEATKARLEAGAPLVLTNGEVSVLAGHKNGLAAACVTSGEKDIPKHLVDELKIFTTGLEQLEIIIALDCDTKGQRVALQVLDTLMNAGFPSVRAVDLALGDGGDLADFCMLYSGFPDAQRALRDRPDLKPQFEVREVKRWQIMHASELDSLPAVEWLIPGEIPARGLTVIYGPSGVGKSFVTLDYALRIAQNEPVVYMAGEGIAGYGSRVKAWTTHHRQSVGNLFMCLGAVSFMDAEDLTEFVNAVERACKAPSLVIVDTLARSMLGADENSSRDMGKFVASCEQVAMHFDCSVMLVHHTNKGGVAERGSGALRGASDTMIKLLDEDDVVRVECAKSKDSKPFDPYFVKLHPVDIGARDRDGNPMHPPVIIRAEKQPQTADGPLTIKQRDVLNTLAMEVFEFGAGPTELAYYLPDIDQRTLFKILSALKKFGFIEQEAKRQPYCITNAGLEKIGQLPAHTAHTAQHDSHTDNSGQSLELVSTTVMTGSMGSTSTINGQQRLLDAQQQPHYNREDV